MNMNSADPPELGRQAQRDASEDRQPVHRHRWFLIAGVIVLVAATVVGGYYYWRSTFYESTDDAYIEGHPVLVSARVSGNVKRVHVGDNQHVQAGTLLVEIDPCDYQARLDRSLAAVEAAQAVERQAVADINVADAKLTQERQDLQRYEKLAKENAVATQILDHSRASTQVAEANLCDPHAPGLRSCANGREQSGRR